MKVQKSFTESGDQMVATTEVLDALKSIGLNLYERKIYVALLAKRLATAAEVSEISNVPRSRSYDVLESLAEKGFVMMQPSKPIKYVALKPAEALEKTKDAIKKKHDTMVERIDKLAESHILHELEKIYSNSLDLVDPTELTGTLKGRNHINRQLQSIFKEAATHIHISTTEKGLRDLHQNHTRALKKATKRGVTVKILAPVGKDDKAMKELSSVAEVKTGKGANGRYINVDDKHMLMSLTTDDAHDSQDIAFWAHSPHATKSMAAPLFNNSWKGAK